MLHLLSSWINSLTIVHILGTSWGWLGQIRKLNSPTRQFNYLTNSTIYPFSMAQLSHGRRVKHSGSPFTCSGLLGVGHMLQRICQVLQNKLHVPSKTETLLKLDVSKCMALRAESSAWSYRLEYGAWVFIAYAYNQIHFQFLVEKCIAHSNTPTHIQSSSFIPSRIGII